MLDRNKMIKVFSLFISILLIVGIFAGCNSTSDTQPNTVTKKPAPENHSIVLATTTSTQDSGLLDVLIPLFENQTGYMVKTIAVGTGKALSMGEQGEADVLLVHAPASEIPLVDDGSAINRQLVMHNDFVLVGPANDPAGVKGLKSATEALTKLSDSKTLFISRGDDSGTNKKEISIWKAASIQPNGTWYQETGQGMGATLRVASEKGGYTLTDRATYLALQKELSLAILLEGDPSFLNIYHVMQVNPEKFEKVNAEGGKAFDDFMIAPETQDVISKFGEDKYGQPLFFSDAGKDESSLHN